MKMSASLVVAAIVFAQSFVADSSWAASPEDEIRATLVKFVAAQNAHDLKAVEALLLDSPQFLWISRGNVVWGRTDALKRFEAFYKGTWHLEPDLKAFKIVLLRPQVAQIFVPIVFSIGAAGQPAQDTTSFINQVLVKGEAGWRISSILPIPAPSPTK